MNELERSLLRTVVENRNGVVNNVELSNGDDSRRQEIEATPLLYSENSFSDRPSGHRRHPQQQTVASTRQVIPTTRSSFDLASDRATR